MNTEREDTAANVLQAWAEAIRGSWGDIDGRSCKAELEQIVDYLRGEKDDLTFKDVGVCNGGGKGHWPGWDGWYGFCDMYHSEDKPMKEEER